MCLKINAKEVIYKNDYASLETMRHIATILPSRDAGTGRKHRLRRCIDSWVQHTEDLSSLFVLLDQDDLENYTDILDNFNRPDINFVIMKSGISLMEKINGIGVDLANKYEAIAFLGDDVVLRTPWESTFLEYLRLVPAGVVYGNTCESSENVWWATHPCVSSNLIRAVGFYGCPAVKHNCFDVYWSYIGKEIGYFKYFEEVIFDHRRSQKDVDALWWSVVALQREDNANFERYKQEHIGDDLEKIRLLLQLDKKPT